MIRRLVRAYESATPEQVADGREWYSRAYVEALALSVGTDLTPRQCAGVIAALSPRVTWAQNLIRAARMVDIWEHCRRDLEPPRYRLGLGLSIDRAWRIVSGEGRPLDVLGGKKTRAFYRNITGDRDAVTVDVWAARIAYGREVGLTDNRYDTCARAYAAAAAKVGECPRDFQAITWIAARGSAT